VASTLQGNKTKLNFPNESSLGGFCKGAVREQMGARKKGFTFEHKRDGGAQDFVSKCTKCSFTGPAKISAALPSGGRGAVKREKTMDNHVRMSPSGIKYRWMFLAKSHVSSKANPLHTPHGEDVFGCYFCCVERVASGWLIGRPNEQFSSENKDVVVTPTFVGSEAFLAHLETHQLPERTPCLIAANEMNCIVGRIADDREDFDLNLPPPGVQR
jgi:hypothetical protein